MLSIFDFARDLTDLAIIFRLILVLICGGAIGIEREYRRRSAGVRTHILICLGSAMAMLIPQYLVLVGHFRADLTRMGAGVVGGIGFIGAGTIIVTSKSKRVKGLTTASGLWTCAIIGLAFGSGFIEAGILATILVLLIESIFIKLEKFVMDNAKNVDLYVEYYGKDTLDKITLTFNENNVKVTNIEINKENENDYNATFSIILDKIKIQELKTKLREIETVSVIEG